MFTLSKRLLYLRELHDLSQTTISKMLHMSQVGYYAYEIGRSNPSPETLLKLANFYNVSVDFLLGNEAENTELSKLFQDIKKMSPDNQQKMVEHARLLKVDATLQAEQQRRADRKQQRLAGEPTRQTKKPQDVIE